MTFRSSSMQLPLFDTPSDWRPPVLADLPSWRGAKRVAFDCETCDPKLKKLGSGSGRRPGSFVAGWSYAIEDGPAGYLPVRHAGGDNLPLENVVRYLREQAAEFDGVLVGAHLPYDLDFSANEGIEFKKVKKCRDVQVADPLIYELHQSYSLETICQRWGFEGKHEALLREAARNYGMRATENVKNFLWKLPARFVGEYGEFDARLPLQVLRKQERKIDEDDLWTVYDLESDLLPVLTDIRRRGIRIDLDRLARIEAWSLREERAALAEVKRISGVTIDVGQVWKPEVVARALVAIGFRVRNTSQGRPNIDKLVFAQVGPVGEAIEWARKVNKLRTTFAASIRNHLTPDGRIHCGYNQLRSQKDDDASDDVAGAAYGRASCEHPNLQQQPARDEFGPAWRAIFLPEEGERWASLDFSQQEPRMAVHYACLSRSKIGSGAWERAIVVRDMYRNDPSTDNHQMMADLAGIGRKAAKEIFLGLAYGMGGAKMCKKLGLPTRMVVRSETGVVVELDTPEGRALAACGCRRWEAAGAEGQELIDKFNERVPFIRATARACERKARQAGFIKTLSGRRCHFPQDFAGNFDWTHKAFNRVIQGSSADQMKLAMIALARAGIVMLVQVHDEIGISFAIGSGDVERGIQAMLDCCPLEVPSKVDAEEGASWGASMLDAARAKIKSEKDQREFDAMNEIYLATEALAA